MQRRRRATVAAILAAVALPAVVAEASVVPTGAITTIAGGVVADAPATAVSVQPAGVATDARGNVYFADAGANQIWRLTPEGRAAVVAGDAATCPSTCDPLAGDEGPATAARLGLPYVMTASPDGDVYFSQGNRIRKVDGATGVITHVAGNGDPYSQYTYAEENAHATEATVSIPFGLAADSRGNVYLNDFGSPLRIRRIAADGTITTVAGCGREALWECDGFPAEGREIAGTYIGGVRAIAVDRADRLYLAYSNSVYLADLENGVYRHVAGSPSENASEPGQGEGGPAGAARFRMITAMAFAPDNSLLLLDQHWQRVQRIAAPVGPDAVIEHVAGCSCTAPGSFGVAPGYGGDGYPATSAQFGFTGGMFWHVGAPSGIAAGPDGDVYLGDFRNLRLRRIDAVTGLISTAAGSGSGGPQARVNLLKSYHPQWATGAYSGDGGPATRAQLYPPLDVAVDADRNVYVLDAYARRIRRIAPDGTITTVAGGGCVADATTCNPSAIPLGDGGPALGARLTGANHLALDATGTQLLVTQLEGDTPVSRVRQINLGTSPVTVFPDAATPITIPAGGIATIYGGARCTVVSPTCNEAGFAPAVPTNGLGGPAFDRAGNIYVPDHEKQWVRRIDARTGVVTTVLGVNGAVDCGGYGDDGRPGLVTRLCGPIDVAVAPNGNLYVAEAHQHFGLGTASILGTPRTSRIRMVDMASPLRTTTVVVGNGVAGFSGDGGSARHAQLTYPHGMDFGPDGSLYVADTGNNRIRRVTPDGTIATVAGSGPVPSGDYPTTAGCASGGDGGAADEASLCLPLGLDVAADGTVYVADTLNNRVRTFR